MVMHPRRLSNGIYGDTSTCGIRLAQLVNAFQKKVQHQFVTIPHTCRVIRCG